MQAQEDKKKADESVPSYRWVPRLLFQSQVDSGARWFIPLIYLLCLPSLRGEEKKKSTTQIEIFIHRSPKVFPKHNMPVYKLFTVYFIQHWQNHLWACLKRKQIINQLTSLHSNWQHRGEGKTLHLLATARRILGKQYIINRVGILLRSPGLMKNAIRHLMTTGEENLGFTSHLKPSMQNRKWSIASLPQKTLPTPISLSTFLFAFGQTLRAPSVSCGTSFWMGWTKLHLATT